MNRKESFMNSPEIGGVYKHFKGNYYKVLHLATHSETRETLVIYQALYGEGGIYARPLEMFMSPVDKEKYPDVDQEYRFERQKSAVDPGVMDFLDADTCERKLEILARIHPRITDDMINTMAVSLDMEIKDGKIEDRYEELKYSIMTRARFECTRLR